MRPIVEAGMTCERRLRMRSTLRHTRALRASCVEIGGPAGGVASALSCARLATDVEEDWAFRGRDCEGVGCLVRSCRRR